MLSVYDETITVMTHGEGDIINLSPLISVVVKKSGIKKGTLNIFSVGSTAAVTTIEYETGVLEDFKRSLSSLAPENISYKHDKAWGDGNGRSHVKAAFIGPSLTVPVRDCLPVFGTWQQPVLIELDTRSERKRNIHCTITGFVKN